MSQETHLRVVQLQVGEFEVLESLDVHVPDQEVPVLLRPALLQGPVLSALDPPALHHPGTRRRTESNSHLADAFIQSDLQ